MNTRAVALISLVSLIAAPVWAHHNMSAIFNFDDRITGTGVLTEIDWRNPHIYLFVDVENDAGETEAWAFEGPPPFFFRNRDFSRTDFEDALGKTVRVEASRARDGSMSALIRELTLPDGRVISACPQNC
jgi:hypothetical protein